MYDFNTKYLYGQLLDAAIIKLAATYGCKLHG
jgi:hypothetical protein